MSIREWFKRAEDRRRADRHHPEDLIAFFWTGGRPMPQQVSDIGPYGARIMAPAGFYPGTLVVLVLVDRAARQDESESQHDLCVCGKVTRNEADGFGVEFQFGSTAERRNFRLFFNKLKRSTKHATEAPGQPKVEGAGTD